MLRRRVTGVAVFAMLSGLAAGPYTHAHRAIGSFGDERHPHGQTLVHTHATPHTHHDSNDEEPKPAGSPDEEQVWSVASFVFPQPVAPESPAPILPASEEPVVVLTSVWLGEDLWAPRAHAPPGVCPPPLRAPPVRPPAFL